MVAGNRGTAINSNFSSALLHEAGTHDQQPAQHREHDERRPPGALTFVDPDDHRPPIGRTEAPHRRLPYQSFGVRGADLNPSRVASFSAMLLTITNTARPATDLGYLLYKNPARVHEFIPTFGRAHVFYPKVSEERCTAALLVEVDRAITPFTRLMFFDPCGSINLFSSP